MIEPTSRDIGRKVIWARRDGTTLIGRLTSFEGEQIYLRIAGEKQMAPRGQLEWATVDNDPVALAARGVIERAGFAIRVVDQYYWDVEGWSFWPGLGTFRKPDGRLVYGGPVALVMAIQAARKQSPGDP